MKSVYEEETGRNRRETTNMSLNMTIIKKKTTVELFHALAQINTEIDLRGARMIAENGWASNNIDDSPDKIRIADYFGQYPSPIFINAGFHMLSHLCLLSEDEMRYDFGIQADELLEMKQRLGQANLHFRRDNVGLIHPPEDDIEVLGLSIRAYNCLRRFGIRTVADLCQMTEAELQRVRNIGTKSAMEVKEKLYEYGCSLIEEPPFADIEQGNGTDNNKAGKVPAGDRTTNGLECEGLDCIDEDFLDGASPNGTDNDIGSDAAEVTDSETGEAHSLSAEERLGSLIGLEDVKLMVSSIADYAEVKKKYPKPNIDADASLHMLFKGNPGTAKTTVARIVARTLYEKGILEKPEIHEVGRSDLIGEYIGKTAPLVVAAFDKAKGGVLFIDEAYSLAEGYNGYGTEAITTIVQEMENRRNDTVVIFAGYDEKMEGFLNSNEGLASRIKFQIRFPDYSEEEMFRLLEYMAAEYGFSLTDDVEEMIMPMIVEECQSGNSGNGRWIRNAVEKAEMNWAKRIKAIPEEQITEAVLTTLLAADFANIEPSANDKKAPVPKHPKVIGF